MSLPHEQGIAQRWRSGRDAYRPAGEVIDPREFDVAPIATDNEAKAFVVGHHYSGSYPAARWRFGLYRHGVLVGVAVFSVPCSPAVLTRVFPGDPNDSVELGRFVLLPEVLANGESWFLGRAFELLRRDGLRGVVSFSDPMRRTNVHGEEVFGGHIGGIYQAHNGVYLGRTKPEGLKLLPNGQALSGRMRSKIRNVERGWVAAVAKLVALGAPELAVGADPAEWLRSVEAQLCRTVRHPGNHRYGWALTGNGRRSPAPPAALWGPRRQAPKRAA
jgi:hypothetical protein